MFKANLHMDQKTQFLERIWRMLKSEMFIMFIYLIWLELSYFDY